MPQPYKRRILLFSLFAFLAGITSSAQQHFPYKISLEPVLPKGFEGLQSYAWGKVNDKILLVGGRTDGLHPRQPFASFSKEYANTELIVLDLKEEKVWKKSISSLPSLLKEQLQSSNMEFFQQNNQLVLIGGYGFSETKRTHITYPALISIELPELIRAIMNKEATEPFIHQLTDERMAVTGGRLNKLGDLFYLVGGQRFEGRYNPHGPDHGPGFSQQYTNQIRKFSLSESNGRPGIINYSAITDSLLLHRRDYNLLRQVDVDGNEILSIYSGVFQYGKDIPFTTLIDINEKGYREIPDFNQQFSHYHTAVLPAYNRNTKTMFSVFFGGIARNYQDSAGQTVSDDNVPFVKSISIVERNDHTVTEFILTDPMPGYFGAAAEFIPANEKLFSVSGILNLDKLANKPTLAGYIIGGIDSRAPNVFWSNEAAPSRASPVIWKVYFSTVKE